ELLYGKGLIYKYFLNDPEKAKERFSSVISQCPDHKTAQSAREELEHSGLAKDSAGEKEPVELSVQNYPNPFNPETRFQLTLPEPGRVVLKIFDILGREVKTLMDADKLAGRYTVVWDGKNRAGMEVASGTYLCQLQFNGQTLTQKILLMR
ncbi:MAG: T9SS type A sorting domain-containing protein, partial [candidate division KSB1 bacterium]|nr:T9SS type A sorting domain-containing protein [candidate division KSB1 bacterium]